jgi:muramidase (phage lysozyme)
MKEQQAKVAAALLFIFSLGSVSPLYAESSSATLPLSENCQRASETSDSFATSMPKILCQQERINREVLDTFLGMSNNLPESDPGPNDVPPPATRRPVEKPKSTLPPKGIKAKRQLHLGDNKDFAPFDKPYTQKRDHGRSAKPRPRRPVKPALSEAAIRDYYYIGRPLSELSAWERRDLRRKLDALLRQRGVVAFLVAIEKGEGGSLVEIVGGTRGKSKDCRRRIRRLNASAHPKDQGLPNRCFLYTRHGLSTAAGKYQIVYYRNWRHLSRLLDLKDFSAKSQARAALELTRSSKVKRGKLGEGLVALALGDLDRAIRKGTDPWASSPYSRWRGKNAAPLLQYARQERKKMENDRYAKRQFESLRRTDSNS